MAGLEKRIFQKSEFKCGYDTFLIVYTVCIRKSNLHQDYSTAEINFLDVTVTKLFNKLKTDLFSKPNDMCHHLHAQSCHRNVYKISIASGQVARFVQ